VFCVINFFWKLSLRSVNTNIWTCPPPPVIVELTTPPKTFGSQRKTTSKTSIRWVWRTV
jgi:hypothetical protein